MRQAHPLWIPYRVRDLPEYLSKEPPKKVPCKNALEGRASPEFKTHALSMPGQFTERAESTPNNLWQVGTARTWAGSLESEPISASLSVVLHTDLQLCHSQTAHGSTRLSTLLEG